jgi:hypothetical protein
MQLRCSYCQTMFAIGHEETLAAIEHMADNNLKYYDAHCPNCRRANRVERFKLEASYPGWQAALKTMVKEADQVDAKQAALAAPAVQAPVAAPKASAVKKTPVQAPKTAKPAVRKAPASKTSAVASKKKPAAAKAKKK